MTINSSAAASISFVRLRYRLILLVIAGVILPCLPIFWYSWQANLVPYSANKTLPLVLATSVLATFLVRKFEDFPGTRSFRYGLPIYATAYALLFVVIAILRVEYSNQVVVAAFVGTLAVHLVVSSLADRTAGPAFFVVPGGTFRAGDLPASLGAISMVDAQLPAQRPIVLVADLHHDHDEQWERLFATAALAGVPVYHFKQVQEGVTGRVQIDHISENSFGSLIPSHAYSGLKRALDLVLCALLLPFLIPVLLAVAALIKLDSKGPVFFRQSRMGFRGYPFRVVKFRTMRPKTGTDHEAGGASREAAMTLADDDRITRLGRFLRRWRVDELPQVFNILVGEMSWIGPRPEAVQLSQWYEAELAFYSYRHIVRPGLTGWAQVNQGHVTNLQDVRAKLQYDFYYIKNFSLWLDLLITLRTLLVIASGFGAK